MKKIIEFFVKNPLFGDLLTLAVIGIGLTSLFLIRREVFPNVNFDIISISTIFPGSSPEEVEKLITNPIEQELEEVDGIKKVVSTSIEGRSGIIVFLDPDQTTASKGKKDIEDAVARIENDFPNETKDPLISELESKQAPVIEVSLASNMPPMQLREIAKNLEKEIEQISGVARVVHKGLLDQEIKVEVSPQKLSSYRLSLEDVIIALRNQNLSIPGGPIEPTKAHIPERIVRTVGDFTDLEDVKKTVIRANDLGQTIKVGDVAQVYFDLEKPTYLFHTNGKPSMGLTVLNKEKADAINVVKAIKKKIKELQPKLDPRLEISFVNDMSEYIERRLSILTGNLGIGLLLVLLLLPLMIPFRFAMMIALGEPFAFLGAMALLYMMDASINLVSLLGLIIVSGILVDDAIVVTENAVRLIEEEGYTPEDAAIKGTLQIMGPLTASVMTTAMSFLPMMFMSGIFGKFIREIPIAVLACLGVSLLETFIILPAHVSHWIRPSYLKALREKNNKERSRNKNFIARFFEGCRTFWELKILPNYLRLLKITLRWRYLMMFLLVFTLSGTIYFAATKMRFILFPPEGIEVFFIRTEAPTGTSLEQNRKILKPIEQIVQALPKEELDNFTTSIGIIQQDPNDPNTKRGSQYAQIAVYLTPEQNRTRFAHEIINELRVKIGRPEPLVRISYERVNPGPPTGKPVSLGVRAENYDEILQAVEDLKKLLSTIPGVLDITDSYSLGKEELQVHVKANEAAAAYLNVATIGSSVRASFEGIVATTVRKLSEKVDVRVSFPKESRSDTSTLDEILIPNQRGNLIPISQVTTTKKSQGIASFDHEDNLREVKVMAEVNTEMTSALEVNNKIRGLLDQFRQKHQAVSIDFGGEDEDTQESFKSLGRAFVLALIGIFLMLVLTFKQLLQPLLVLITIPLGLISVTWAFFFQGLPLSFMGMIGIIALCGVIVNNAIVFLDFVNQERDKGVSRYQSILNAAKIRVRPIFLTTITTTVGVLPTAYGVGGLDKFVVPIAFAIGWGLLFGSLLTAFIFPSALAVLDDLALFLERKAPKLANLYKNH